MRYSFYMVCLACLWMTLGLTGCNYEDGPVISLRSKRARMAVARPMTYYENNGIDSTAALNQRFADSIGDFAGKFYFSYEPSNEVQGIYDSEDIRNGKGLGYWLIYGYDDFESISICGLGGQTWPCPYWWTVTRLTHSKLWLERPAGRKLRFEK
jgi:hypothetical protein